MISTHNSSKMEITWLGINSSDLTFNHTILCFNDQPKFCQKNLLQLPLPFYVSFILKWIVDDTIPPNNSDALSETLSQSLSESLSETMFQSLSGACLKPRFRIAPIRPFLKPPTFYPRSFWPTFKIPKHTKCKLQSICYICTSLQFFNLKVNLIFAHLRILPISSNSPLYMIDNIEACAEHHMKQKLISKTTLESYFCIQ